jgi:hypothetical protein
MSQLHLFPDLLIQIFRIAHSEIVDIIIAAGHQFYFDKARVVIIRLHEPEYDINKVLTGVCHIGEPGS